MKCFSILNEHQFNVENSHQFFNANPDPDPDPDSDPDPDPDPDTDPDSIHFFISMLGPIYTLS